MSKDKPSLDQLMRDAYAGVEEALMQAQAMYTKYLSAVKALQEPDFDLLIDAPAVDCLREMTEEEFYYRLETDQQFKQRWK